MTKFKTQVSGEILSINVTPAGNGKVYPKITFQGIGRFNPQVECVPGLTDQVSSLQPGQVVTCTVYTKFSEIELRKKDGGTFRKSVDYIDNAYEIEVNS